ncbi:7-alpha-hydroxycholest-4-en-3-one 12-alpha-hydroxylase [Fusarium beomiforme]|uniref:7-alpha-hydroxycholest-4-en-3-one 12-alpha-hydroxylase n=1 Tax=Fusarium beomiforme TaxID=44412 RepID=A0A9P5A5H4_9HYPO|nr:7-alpha-hydroxycholest-4-en-3-one 12-alpha-hydroxylase [Fusarium beomiforme]
MILDPISLSGTWLVVILTALLLLFSRYVSPSVDSLEPPLLKPRAPLVGHIISLFKEGGGFYSRLFKNHRMPICTLPMLNGKLYIINSPDLIQSALKNNDISFDPFIIESAKGLWGLSQNSVDHIADEDNKKAGLTIIHSTLMGEPLHRINLSALTRLMTYINPSKTKEALEAPDVFVWLRDILTDATTTALLGEKNPLTADKAHLLWTFDKQSMLLAMGVPSFVTKNAINARDEVNKLLLGYYESGGENGKGVSDLMRERAELLRRTGLSNDDLSHMEMMLPWVGVTNTVSTLFWLFAHVLTNPEYVSRVRSEIEDMTVITVTPGGRKATFDVRKLEKDCPFLHACYQECLRLYLHAIGNRRVMEDTKIQDAQGRSYLLKKGVNIQWSPSVAHLMEEIWGPDAATFRPERFLDVSMHDEKKRRGSQLSFGGGKHLCPGRKFASTEILGFVGVVAASFGVENLSLPKSKDPAVGAGPRMPDWGDMSSGFKLRRREGWEDVTWVFEE